MTCSCRQPLVTHHPPPPPAATRRLAPAAEPYLRILDPVRDYRPANPPWLVEAAATAASAAAAPASTDGDGDVDDEAAAVAALPPAVRDGVVQLRATVAAGRGDSLMGHAAKRSLFALEEEGEAGEGCGPSTYLNHGSYGAALRMALEAQRHFRVRRAA